MSCIEPPNPPNGTHLSRQYVGGQTVAFGEVVDYTCEEGYFFGIDKNLTSVNLTCYSNGSWELPGAWEKCYHPSGNS